MNLRLRTLTRAFLAALLFSTDSGLFGAEGASPGLLALEPVHRVPGTNGATRLVPQSHLEFEKAKPEGIAFLAVATNSWPAGLVPIFAVEKSGRITPPGHPEYHFQPKEDLVLDKKTPLPGHANGMTFSAFDGNGRLLLRQIYYSIGGGFVVTDTELEKMRAAKKAESQKVPYPFASAKQMLEMAQRSGLTIAQMKRASCSGSSFLTAPSFWSDTMASTNA